MRSAAKLPYEATVPPLPESNQYITKRGSPNDVQLRRFAYDHEIGKSNAQVNLSFCVVGWLLYYGRVCKYA
jgi:hypothetical protein